MISNILRVETTRKIQISKSFVHEGKNKNSDFCVQIPIKKQQKPSIIGIER